MKSYTDVTIILDRSGSMNYIKSDVIGGLNTFIRDQQSDEEPMLLSLVQFDDRYAEVYIGKDIKEVPFFTDETYVPRGMTALRDAIGKTIGILGERFKKMPETERPEKVIVVIQTDGMENASREYTQQEVEEMIKHQTEKYSWKFIFLGAGLDVASQAASMGINVNNTLAHGNNVQGYATMYSSVSRSISSMKSMDSNTYKASSAFSSKDKDDAEDTLFSGEEKGV